MNTGWICPKCGRVWAPWVDRCDACTAIQLTGGEVIEPFMPGPYIPHTPQTGDPLPPPNTTVISDSVCESPPLP